MQKSWLAAALLTLTLSSNAFAQSDADKSLARSLGAEGQEALDKGDYKTAEERFKRADQLYHAPTLVLGLARAQAKGKRYLAAQETYNKIIREGAGSNAAPAFVKAVEDARVEVEQVAGKLAYLVVNVAKNGADRVEITVDDERMSDAAVGLRRPVDPGKHKIKASSSGFRTFSQDVELTEGGSKSVDISMEKDTGPVAAGTGVVGAGTGTATGTGTGTGTGGGLSGSLSSPPPDKEPSSGGGGLSGQKMGAIAAWGVGGVGLVAGIITGAIASGKHGSLETICDLNGAGDDKCPETIPAGQENAGTKTEDQISSMRTMATISTIGFIVAGVGAATGTVLWLTAKDEKKTETAFVRPFVGLGSVGAFGRF